MKQFNIDKPCEAVKPLLIDKIDNLTKPKGSLGMLETLALKVGMIQQTLTPQLCKPVNIVFAADHGIVDEGVSFSPKEVTRQQIFNFAEGGGGINFLCRQHGFTLKIVDAGVDYDFPKELALIDLKIRKGTSNYLYGPAMSMEEMNLCIERGAAVVEQCRDEGCNIISFGELAMGNTSSSSIWMHLFTGTPLAECVGAGSGLPDEGIRHKYDVLNRAVKNSPTNLSDEEKIAYFGGFEMVMAIGAMLKAAESKMTILVDGFIMTACVIAAVRLYPHLTDYCIFGHCGDESGHKKMLDFLGAKSVLNLGLRLGEGSGAVCAYPIVESAVRMINEMASFKSASVTKYFK